MNQKKKIGRPPKNRDEKLSEIFEFRLTPRQAKAIKEYGKLNGLIGSTDEIAREIVIHTTSVISENYAFDGGKYIDENIY